jgi:hypothetical protein
MDNEEDQWLIFLYGCMAWIGCKGRKNIALIINCRCLLKGTPKKCNEQQVFKAHGAQTPGLT